MIESEMIKKAFKGGFTLLSENEIECNCCKHKFKNLRYPITEHIKKYSDCEYIQKYINSKPKTRGFDKDFIKLVKQIVHSDWTDQSTVNELIDSWIDKRISFFRKNAKPNLLLSRNKLENRHQKKFQQSDANKEI